MVHNEHIYNKSIHIHIVIFSNIPLSGLLSLDLSTNALSITIQIRGKNYFSVTPDIVIISLNDFAHVTTAELPCHVKNIAAIGIQDFGWEQNEISITFQLWWKNS